MTAVGEPARLDRQVFETSRQMDFLSERELTLQCGFGPAAWHLVAVKELIDNALDACEEQGVAPEVTVTVDEESITVADNGAGIGPHVVDRLLDFTVRVSSRAAYVAPDRGAQGNALKTIVAMPFVLDRSRGRVDIVGGGVLNEISLSVDRIAEHPVAEVTRSARSGSSVTVYWPSPTSSLVGSVDTPFLQDESLVTLAHDFAFLNPHMTLTLEFFGERTRIDATDPAWSKWTPSAPTSPHWYEVTDLERLIAANITHDRRAGGDRERTVREFVSEFRGLSSTAKQKRVLDALGLARSPLSALLVDGDDFDHDRVGRLLDAMRAESKPVRPAVLGELGRDHLAARFEMLGIREHSFEYKRVSTLGDDGLPQVTEAAFGALDDPDAWRCLITGINWSAAWLNPFRTLAGSGLDAVLQERRLDRERPVVVLVHVAHPRVEYTDRGKSSAVVRSADVITAVDAVGRRWTKQMKAEERHRAAELRRWSMYAPKRETIKAICYEHMADVWDRASDGGQLPAHWRQMFYLMRTIVDADPACDGQLVDRTFKGYVEEYLEEHSPGWDVLRGARGVFKEPHAPADDNGLPMSTLGVRGYLAAARHMPDDRVAQLSLRYPTHGAANRISAVMICEKEGFDEQLAAAQVPDRYDLALMSTKGISAFAARDLAADLDVPCFTLHDFDKNGFVMAAGFPFATDLGLRLADVTAWGLSSERQTHKDPDKAYDNLIANGATAEEAAFISGGRRVELNMLPSRDFVRFVETKLDQHGVTKVIPDTNVIADAWRHAHVVAAVNRYIASFYDPATADNIDPAVGDMPDPPDNLADQIRRRLNEDPTLPWDAALAQIVTER